MERNFRYIMTSIEINRSRTAAPWGGSNGFFG